MTRKKPSGPERKTDMQTVQLKNGHIITLNPEDALDLTEAVREHCSDDLADLIWEKMGELKDEMPEDHYEPCMFRFTLEHGTNQMECHLDMNSENGRRFMENLIRNRSLQIEEMEQKTGALNDDDYFRYLLQNRLPEDAE